MSQLVVFWVNPASAKKNNGRDGKDNNEDESVFDKLGHKKMSNITTNELSNLMRDSQLESTGRKILISNDVENEIYLRPEQ
ncbi:hypothetical protein C6P45_003891, partial [Maudiozyma exigua]